jgi:hypothetical protein
MGFPRSMPYFRTLNVTMVASYYSDTCISYGGAQAGFDIFSSKVFEETRVQLTL